MARFKFLAKAILYVLILMNLSWAKADSLILFRLDDFPIYQDTLAKGYVDSAPLQPQATQLKISGQKGFKSVVSPTGIRVEQDLDLNVEGLLADSLYMGLYIQDKDLPMVGDGSTSSLEEIDQIRLGIWGNSGRFDLGQLSGEFFSQSPVQFNKEYMGVKASWQKPKWGTHVFSGKIRGMYQNKEILLSPGLLGDYVLEKGKRILPNSQRVYLDGRLLMPNKDYWLDPMAGTVRLSVPYLPKGGEKLWLEYQILEQESLDELGDFKISNEHSWGKMSWESMAFLGEDSLKNKELRENAHLFSYSYLGLKWQPKLWVHLQSRDSLSRNYLGRQIQWEQNFVLNEAWSFQTSFWDQDRDYLPTHNENSRLQKNEWIHLQNTNGRGQQRQLASLGQIWQNPNWLLAMKEELWRDSLYLAHAVEFHSKYENHFLAIKSDQRQLWLNQRWYAQRQNWQIQKIGTKITPLIMFNYWDQTEIGEWRPKYEVGVAGEFYKSSEVLWKPNWKFQRKIDSIRYQDFGQSISLYYPQLRQDLNMQFQYSRLDQITQGQWFSSGDWHLNWEPDGVRWQQSHSWQWLISFPLRKSYQKVSSGTGNVLYDSIQKRYIEGVEGGDYRFWGYARDSSVKSKESFEMTSTLSFLQELGKSLALGEGFFKDLSWGLDYDYKSKDSSGTWQFYPVLWGVVSRTQVEVSRKLAPKVIWEIPKHRLQYTHLWTLERWEGQNVDQNARTQKTDYRFDEEPWDFKLSWEKYEAHWGSSEWNLMDYGTQLTFYKSENYSLGSNTSWRQALGLYGSDRFEIEIPQVGMFTSKSRLFKYFKLSQEISWIYIPKHNVNLPYKVDEGYEIGSNWRFAPSLAYEWEHKLTMNLRFLSRIHSSNAWYQWELSGLGRF